MKLKLASLTLTLLVSTGCNGSRTVGGQLDQTQFQLKDAQAVAIGADGRTWRSNVQPDGRFEIALPNDGTYSIRFANSTEIPDRYDAFAILTFTNASGDRHRNFRLTPGEPIELGVITRVNTSMSALTSAADDLDDGDDDGDVEDDGDTEDDDEDTDSDGRQDDEALACDFSSDGDLVVVEGQSNLLSSVDSDDDGVSDDEDSDDCDSEGDSDDGDDDDDSESGMVCENAAGLAEDACDDRPVDQDPPPAPGAGGAGGADCATNPSDPNCL